MRYSFGGLDGGRLRCHVDRVFIESTVSRSLVCYYHQLIYIFFYFWVVVDVVDVVDVVSSIFMCVEIFFGVFF